jgi:hypothetical protein
VAVATYAPEENFRLALEQKIAAAEQAAKEAGQAAPKKKSRARGQ